MSLANKYRPKFFRDVVGQDLSIIENDIKKGIYNNYIFAGQYGSGKTTVARIFAKAVNCKNRVDIEPCNECALCKAVDNNSSLFVKEYDASVFGRIETIRNIREQLKYSIGEGIRVFILDEVQNMSKEAYESLLKILEEKSNKVIFILITTELWKIPDTIKSRCVLVNFRRLSSENVKERLLYIIEQEKIDIDIESVELISDFADGSLRDGIKYLEIVSDLAEINIDVLTHKFGILSRNDMNVLEDFILSGRGVKEVYNILNKGVNYKYIFKRLIKELFKINMDKRLLDIYNALIDFYSNLNNYNGIEVEVFISMINKFYNLSKIKEERIKYNKMEFDNESKRDFYKLFKMV